MKQVLSRISSARQKFTHPKPELGNIPACDDYARQAIKLSTKPYSTLGYIWSRFLIDSFLQGVKS
jgi:hypothetical protein